MTCFSAWALASAEALERLRAATNEPKELTDVHA